LDPFAIMDCALIAIATGEKAHNLREFCDRLRRMDEPAVTYFHFWGGLLRPHFVDPEYQNDFAAWAYHDLHDRRLAERLSILNPTEFESINDLRLRIIDLVEERMDEEEFDPHHDAENPFFFLRSQIVIFDTRQRIQAPKQLERIVPNIALGSLFYHLIDARRRTESGRDDFTEWLWGWGRPYADCAAHIAAIDPYFNSLRELRAELENVLKRYIPKGNGS
jgi:hypothetical protein